MHPLRRALLASAAALAACSAPALRADVVQLVNGDTINGKVVSLDETQLKLKSEVLGEMSLPRDKVASIYLGDGRPPAAAVPARAAVPAAPVDKARLLGPPGDSVEEILDNLQKEGVDIHDVNELKKQFPLLAMPAAGAYFDRTVEGLNNGTIGVGDIRKDAIKARDQLQDLKKDLARELGPGSDGVLDSYLGILDNFIEQTEPPKPAEPAPLPAPKADPVTPRVEFPPRGK